MWLPAPCYPQVSPWSDTSQGAAGPSGAPREGSDLFLACKFTANLQTELEGGSLAPPSMKMAVRRKERLGLAPVHPDLPAGPESPSQPEGQS